MATPPPREPLSRLMKLILAPVVRSCITVGGQCLGDSQVSVSIARCSLFSSNNVMRLSIFSTIDLAFAQAILNLLELGLSIL